MKELMLGNEAVARGLYEADVKVVSSYPGTPSTEITEYAALYDEIYCEWAPNEKVSFETAFGAAVGGVRAFCAMKHVGLNVAADPLYSAAYTGVNGGLVCAVADDPGMHSSQNEQDSRHHAIASKTPMLEPSDSAECLEYTKLAFQLSEQFDVPFLLRLSTRISHSRSLVSLSEREEAPLRPYTKDITKNVMMPTMARKGHVRTEKRLEDIREWSETSGIHQIEMNDATNKESGGTRIGVITSGIAYSYAKEALNDSVSYLKLGMLNPLPVQVISDFAKQVDKIYVIEELDDVIETHCRKLGIDVIGKSVFPICGELSQSIVLDAVLGKQKPAVKYPDELPQRPPMLCAGCPHRGVFYALKKLDLFVFGDIGCYTLGAYEPLSAMDIFLCMGAAVSGMHGFNLARGKEQAKKSVAVIGDSTFIHSGITGLIDIAYNKGISTVIVLDNSTTGMTGHQQNPSTGLTIRNEPTVSIDLERLAPAVGINRVCVVDPYDVDAVLLALKSEIEVDEPSLIIARRPCALLKQVKRGTPASVNPENCTGCKACMKVGCPAIFTEDKKATIDPGQCSGCRVCAAACQFGAII